MFFSLHYTYILDNSEEKRNNNYLFQLKLDFCNIESHFGEITHNVLDLKKWHLQNRPRFIISSALEHETRVHCVGHISLWILTFYNEYVF